MTMLRCPKCGDYVDGDYPGDVSDITSLSKLVHWKFYMCDDCNTQFGVYVG